jgi:hypothetical protein
MQQWEYIFLVAYRVDQGWKIGMVNGKELANWKVGPSLYDFINQRGNEGWDLVNVTFAPIFTQTGFVDTEDYRLVMKRAKG